MEQGFRHEYKYLISRASAMVLKKRLPHIMKPDPHVGKSGMYTIRSLYFDDPIRTAYEEKVQGVCHRIKYRIRCYNGNCDVLKLEKKEKHGSLTKKTAQTISVPQVRLMENYLPWGDDLALEVYENRQLRPCVLVEYDRTPFVCTAGNTRITLDEGLRTHPCCTDLFASSAAMVPVLEQDQVVLEVKFDDFLPAHLAAALSDIPKHSMAVSKYALCLEASELL